MAPFMPTPGGWPTASPNSKGMLKRGAPGRLDGGTAPVACGEGLLVLLQELRHLPRDSSLGSSGELEDSCCLGKRWPPASQMHTAARHVVTILIAPTSCQAYLADTS